MPNNKNTPASQSKRGSKSEKVIALLKRDLGASLPEITKATGWLPHSARAVLTGFRKKGFAIDKAKVDGLTRYRITAEPAA
jgi:hypothetical protein